MRLLFFVVLLAAPALADIPPADSIGCRDKQLGDACQRDDKSAGQCVTSTCTRNDYSNGPPPKQVSYDCLVCGAGTPPTEKKCAVIPGEAALLLALGWLMRRSTRA